MWKACLPAMGLLPALATRTAETIRAAPRPQASPHPPRPFGAPALGREQVAGALRATLRLQQAILRLAEMGDRPSRAEVFVTVQEVEDELRSIEYFRRRLITHARGRV